MIELTPAALRDIFPRAPQAVLESFIRHQDLLSRAGINHTRQRLKYFFANIEHECGGFTIPRLTENINYTHERMAQVWPNRFASAQAVAAKYGTAPGWQKAAFDDIYGNRMGNRPGTHDGSTYIGRGGPQWTGRDGYQQLANRTGLDAVRIPEKAAEHAAQTAVCVAFWEWKRLNECADLGDFRTCVKRWNGGTNGMADRLAKMKGNDPFIDRLNNVAALNPVTAALPGQPPTADPPKAAVDAVTRKERNSRKIGGATAVGGGTNETVGVVDTPANKPMPTWVAGSAIAFGVIVVLVATYLIARKRFIVKSNWH